MGGCCAAFPLSATLAKLWAIPHTITEGEQIAGLVIPLDPFDVVWRRVLFGLARGPAPVDQPGRAVDDGREYFTCRAWDETTRLCTIYEKRPGMCRDYPYAGTCDHCGFSGASL